MPTQHRLTQALDSWQQWSVQLAEKPQVIEPLNSGETNQSFLIQSGNNKFVLRLNRLSAGILGVDRQQELCIWNAVAEIGIAPKIIHADTQAEYLVYAYVSGRVWTAQDFANPSQLIRLKQLVSHYQSLQFDLTTRNYVNYLSHYWQQIEQQGLASGSLKTAWHNYLPLLEQLQHSNWTACLSHHDLIPENIIESDDRLFVVDWEYAALGHPDLDWSWVSGEKQSPISEVIGWINRLWYLLA